eukprot:gene11816-25445_t
MSKVVYTPRSILLTGGAGFIGSGTVLRLIREYPDYKIVVLDKLDYCSSVYNLDEAADHPKFKLIKGNIGNLDLVSYLLRSEEIDTIINFAAQTHVDNSFGNSIDFTKDNVIGTHVLLEASRHYGGIKRYGENDPTKGGDDQFDETKSAMNPTNPYAATKAAAEMLCN